MTTERTHTPGPWRRYGAGNLDIRDAIDQTVARTGALRMSGIELEGNAALIALAPTAPHECAPDCPGEQNRRKLAAHDALVTALDGLLNELDSRAEKRSWDTHRAALALARGDA